MGIGGQHHFPAALSPGRTRYPLYRRLGGPQDRSGRVRKISHPTGIRSPDRPARSESLKRLGYPGPLGERVRDSFKQTPPMPAYVVAFVVSDLKNVSIHDGKNTVWLREDFFPLGKYALSIAQVIMLLENYAEIRYGLPKVDQVVVPNLQFFLLWRTLVLLHRIK